ncbi:BtpA/SgcQ family protein [Anaerorhabdus sp.]|uniref:BtpA/SgcQ family protein n=1 Tax=Anaerorhabdus sp. TaxID=1872524 RepID=UPI002FC71E47
MSRDFLSLFKNKKPIIGMIHLKGTDDEDVFERAKKEIDIYINNGIDGIILETYFGNYIQLERILNYVEQSNLSIPYGVNCLNVDHLGFHLANKYHAQFIQIDSVVGHVKERDEPSLHEFFKIERENSEASLIGGVRFKYQPVLSERTVEEDLKIAMTRCDGICVTGEATGENTSIEKIKLFKEVVGDFPVIVAAGITKDTLVEQMNIADAAIIGSYFKDTRIDTGDVCAEHVKEITDIMNRMRGK